MISQEKWAKWLDNHCQSCGEKLSKRAVNGGRCDCGKSLASVSAENLQSLIKEAEENGVGPK